jgi:hypothetical protein
MRRINKEQHKKILAAAEDYIFDLHHFPSIRIIGERSGLSIDRCRRIVDDLVSERVLSIVHQHPGTSTIYVPSYMLEDVLRAQRKPDWLAKYQLPERATLDERLRQAREDVSEFDLLERLLYATDTPLEEAVAYGLEFLEFDNVEHITDDKDNPDIRFDYEGNLFVNEIKGKSRQASKHDILQVDGWAKKEVEEHGADPTKVVRMIFVNHFRMNDPVARGDPLTQHAKSMGRLYNVKLNTTFRLYVLVCQVREGNLTKADACAQIAEGIQY